MFSVFLSSYRNTRESQWENSKKLWKHSSAARVPTAFLVLPNFHSCFYNSIETRYMFCRITTVSHALLPYRLFVTGTCIILQEQFNYGLVIVAFSFLQSCFLKLEGKEHTKPEACF